MHLKVNTSYAIRVMLVLAKYKKQTSCELAEALNIKATSLIMILKKLKQASFLTTTQGVSGGYSLGINPDKITMLDIMKVMEPTICIYQNMNQANDCINQVFMQLQNRIEDELSKASIAELSLHLKKPFYEE